MSCSLTPLHVHSVCAPGYCSPCQIAVCAYLIEVWQVQASCHFLIPSGTDIRLCKAPQNDYTFVDMRWSFACMHINSLIIQSCQVTNACVFMYIAQSVVWRKSGTPNCNGHSVPNMLVTLIAMRADWFHQKCAHISHYIYHWLWIMFSNTFHDSEMYDKLGWKHLSWISNCCWNCMSDVTLQTVHRFV